MMSALCVGFNVVLGSFITLSGIPFLFLDGLGTIFMAVNFGLGYRLVTAIGTHLVLAMYFGPMGLPFVLVSITTAIVAYLCSKRNFNYKTAIFMGIMIVFVGSFVSAPIRLIFYGGFKGSGRSLTDLVVVSLKASGYEMFFATYWGAFTDGLIDKIISCLLVLKISQLPKIHDKIMLWKYSGGEPDK